jgi:rod shape-determining protein MreC
MPNPRQWLLGIIGFVGLMLIALAGFVRPVRDAVSFVVLPVARFTSYIGAGIGRSLGVNQDSKPVTERLQELDARLRSVIVDYVRLRALEEENRSLRAQAKFIGESGFRSVGARVVSRSISYQTAAVTIDRGARDGLEVGQAVVTEEGLFAGKIQTLNERTAVVLLVTDVRSRVAATVSGSDRLAGIVEGQGNGVSKFTLIPQAVSLKRDDVVVTAGTEEKVPSGLAIGLVNDVQSQPTDPFKTASVEPLAPIDRLELVSVIIPG